MTIKGLYNILVQRVKPNPTICDLKAVCDSYVKCTHKSISQVIDFDSMARIYQSEKHLPNTPKSVDAITISNNNNTLILVEKKTWCYFYNNIGTDPLQIAQKVNQYKQDLQIKYTSTNDICSYFASETDVLLSLPHVYIWLTELNVPQHDPMEGFATMMGALVEMNSFDEIKYYTVAVMQNAVKDIPHCRYVPCVEFDNFVHNSN